MSDELLENYMELENILKSDIFFFVTTIAVVAGTLMGVIVSIYAIKILREIRSVIEGVKFRYKFIQKLIKHIIK